MEDNAIKIVRMIYVWGLELVLVIACRWDAGWLMEAPPLLHWLSTWVTAQPWSLGPRGSSYRQASVLGGRIIGSPSQISSAVPGLGAQGRHTLPGGWEAVFPIVFILWIKYLNSFSDSYKWCFYSYMYVGGKERCVRKKPELSTSARLIWENRMKSGWLLPTSTPGGARRGTRPKRVFYFSPPYLTSCPARPSP